MKKILVLAERLNGVTWWRAYRPFELLRRAHPELDFTFKDRNLTIHDLRFTDLVIAYRPSDPVLLRFLEVAKRMGLPVIIDCDDDLINIPITHPLYHDYRDNVSTFVEACALSDLVWVSTKELLYVTDRLNGGVVVPNAITPNELPDKPSPWKALFTWRGSAHHVGDLLAHADWYERSRSLASRWVFKGYYPPLKHGPNATSESWEKDVDLYFDRLKSSGLNVIWKPLEENTFNDSKSNIAWIEATMAGGVCVTNYHNKPGWEGALPDFTTDEEVARQAWATSREHIIENYNLHAVNEKRWAGIQSLTS